MKELINQTNNIVDLRQRLKKPSKKQQIVEAWTRGERDIWHLAEELHTQPSYIASTLQSNGFISGYYDLYTSSASPMNIYSVEFQGKMGFRDTQIARYSVYVLEELHRKFDESHDRAGQHHCLVTALTMYNRARFSGKLEEAKVFKKWFLSKMTEEKTTTMPGAN